MKRFFVWGVAALALFFLLFFGLNLFDAGPEARTPALPRPAADLGPENGFFRLWGIAEPPDTDPATEAYRMRVGELFSPPGRDARSRSPYGHWLARLNADIREHWQGASFQFPPLQGEDIASYFTARRAQIGERQARFRTLLQRYRGALRAVVLKDFTPLNRPFPSRSYLLAVNTAKLFAAGQVLAAVDGGWRRAGDELLGAMEAGFRLVASGRTLTVNNLGKSMIELSLRALASLLNRPACPPELARLVAEGLPDREARGFGTARVREFSLAGFAAVLERIKSDRVVDPFLLKDHFHDPAAFFALERFMAISGPRFFAVFHALASFFVQKNESLALMREFWDGVGKLEEMPPWRWRQPPLGPGRSSGVASGPFWWLRNPMGKMLMDSAVPYNWPILRHYVFRSHELKARYELTRLLARARLAAGTGAKLEESALRGLLEGGGVDPFDGTPYRFSRGRGALYSIGSNAADDGGREGPDVWRDSDIAVPIRFVTGDT